MNLNLCFTNKKLTKLVLSIIFYGLSFQLQAQKFIIYTVQQGETVKDIAKKYHIPPSKIYSFNDNLKPGKKLQEGVTIIIPKQEIMETESDSLKPSGNIIDYKYHTVGDNETVYGLSKKYNSKIEAIKKLNNIEGYDIKLGQILIIPIYSDQNKVQIDTLNYTYYTVKPKQGKWRVAYDHGITIDELERLNPAIKNQNLLAGQKLIVPKFRPVRTEEIRDEKNFIYHTVLPHETLFSLAKKYHTTQEKIIELNPKIKEGLQAGQTIRVDRKDFENGQQDLDKYIYHQVEPKETLFSLSKKFNISIDEIIELNPLVKDGLKTGQIIRFPKTNEIESKSVDNEYVYHTVQPLETLFGLSKQFGISQEKIIQANPIIQKQGLKTGQIIKVRKSSENNLLSFVKDTVFEKTGQLKFNLLDSLNISKPYKIAILLPFNLNKLEQNSENEKCNNLINNTLLDYYSGIKLAIDSLKTYGMQIHYDVFDTQYSPYVTQKILENTDLSDYDFVLGPLKTENIEKVADILELDNTPEVVNKYKGDKVFRNLIVSNGDKESLEKHMINFLNEKLDNKKNFLLIYDETQQPKIDTLISQFKIRPKLIKAKKTKTGYLIYAQNIAKKLSKDDNYILLVSKDTPLIFTVLSSLNSLTQKYPIHLFTLDDQRLYEDVTNDRINTFLANLNYKFPSKILRLLDENLKQSFVRRYKKIPGFAAVNGFDTTFDLLLRAGNADNLFEGLQKIGQTRQTSKFFLYGHEPETGFKNQASIILQLDKDLQLKIVD